MYVTLMSGIWNGWHWCSVCAKLSINCTKCFERGLKSLGFKCESSLIKPPLMFYQYIIQKLTFLKFHFFPPANDPLAYNYSPYAWLNALEFLSGSGVVASLILLDSKHLKRKRLFLYLALLWLCVYYIAWIYYFLEFATFLVLFSISLMPPLYFALLALYLQNRIMFVLCVPFGIAYCWISAQGLWIV